MEWQPIETAPDGGKYFLAFCPKNGLHLMQRWGGHSETFSLIGNVRNPEPTHWMPLPPAPEAK